MGSDLPETLVFDSNGSRNELSAISREISAKRTDLAKILAFNLLTL